MKKVKVGKSKIHGNGLFADESIKRGDVIELVHTIRELEPGVIKTTPTLLGRNYNHSEDSNALNVVDGNNRYLVALKEIKVGGEITTDYRTNPDLEQPDSFTTNDNYISFDYDDTLTTPEGFKLAQQMNKEGKNLYVITARDKVTPQMIERAEAAGIPKENIIPAGSDQEKVRIIKENNITKHIDNKDSVIKALGDTGELFTPDAYPDLKADFVEMELSDDDLNKLREGGFIIDKYPNGGLVEVRGYEGNKFRKNANGKWEYESGRPVEDQLLIQKLTYESKPVGSPVVQGAPKVSLKPIPTRSENLKMISDLSMSPRIADQEKAAQLSELQREQDIFNPQEPDMIMKPKNMNDFKGYEFQVNRALGFPMDKAHFAAEAAAGDVNEEVDNFRHPLAGRYVAEGIADATGNIPYISPALGFIGSNLLGAGHEFMTLVNPGEDDRSLLTRLSEAGEDLYNNYVGSKVGASDMTPEEKTNYLLYLSYNNKLPDGVVIEKDPKAKGPNNLYFKKGPNDPGRYKSSYAEGGELDAYAKGGDPGKGKKGKSKNVQPFVTSDPKEYAYRKAAYDDSLSLFNLTNAQQKIASVNKDFELMTPQQKKDYYYRNHYNHWQAGTTGINPRFFGQDEGSSKIVKVKGNITKNNLKSADTDYYHPTIKPHRHYTNPFSITENFLYKKPVQQVVFQEEIKKDPTIKPIIPIPPGPPPTPPIPEPPSGYPGIMPQYDIDEVPMYATPDGGAEWIGDTQRYIDWDGNSVGYRLPRFRQPGHGGPLIKAGKKHYFHYPSIETRNQIQIIPEEEYKKGGEPKKRKKDSKGRYRSEDGNIRTPITPEMQAVMPPDEWGQYVQEVPEVYTTRTREQQDIKNALDYQNRMAELYPGRPTQSDAIQPADWLWQLGALGAANGLGRSAVGAAETLGTKALPYIEGALNTSIPGMASIPGATIGNAAGAYFAGDAIVNRLYPSTGKIQEGKYGEAAADIGTGLLDLYGANMLSPVYKGAKATASELGKFLGTEEGLLSNAYKVNPLALKENPEMLLYRTQPKNFKAGITEEEEIKSLITDKIIKGEKVPIWLHGKLLKIQNDPEPFRAALNQYHGQWFDKNPQRMEWYMKGRLDDVEGDILRLKLPKQEGLSYNLKNFPEAQKASLNYDAEFIVPREKLFEAEKFSTNDLQQLIQEDAAFNKPHWLRGYKEVPRELPGSPNTFKSSLGSMDMSKYEIKNPDYFTQLLNTYDSRRLSNSNKQFYKDLIANVKKQNGIATERQYNELQRLRTGNFNFGKKGYSNGGPINLFENQRPNSKLNKFIR